MIRSPMTSKVTSGRTCSKINGFTSSKFALIWFLILFDPLVTAMKSKSPANYDPRDSRRYNEYKYSMVPSSYVPTKNFKISIVAMKNDRKEQLAKAMKEKYLAFRNGLESSNTIINNGSSSSLQYKPMFYKNDVGELKLGEVSIDKPIILRTYSSHEKRKNDTIPSAFSRNHGLFSKVPKNLRSAEEATSSARFSGILLFPIQLPRNRIKKIPLFENPTPSNQNKLKPVQLSSSQREFDPTIIVDLLKYFKIPNPRRRLKLKSTEGARTSQGINKEQSTNVFVVPKPKTRVKVTKRLITSKVIPQNFISKETEISKSNRKNIKEKLSPITTESFPRNEMSMFISSNVNGLKEEDQKDHMRQKERPAPVKNIEFSTSPTDEALTNPEISLQLPEGVRDSLRKYLKPLVQTLRPLKKSVPGLPGLDYPILSVVPYTNFYCSNMPWPGYYADTEARCQSWHACDVDGRQATFLCPNGTVFNQALMVCDWWYNTDCLVSPFLYPLNERLFGTLSKNEPVPNQRITPELLDTIFT